jgi:hypothetical protein
LFADEISQKNKADKKDMLDKEKYANELYLVLFWHRRKTLYIEWESA